MARCCVSVVARSAKKRDAESAKDAEVRGACVVVLGYTPALVVGLLIALSGEAINQLPIASVYDHKIIEYGSVRKRDVV